MTAPLIVFTITLKVVGMGVGVRVVVGVLLGVRLAVRVGESVAVDCAVADTLVSIVAEGELPRSEGWVDVEVRMDASVGLCEKKG